MTTLEMVTAELINNNIRVDGCYESIPQKTYRMVIDILHFGEGAIKNSMLGIVVKSIAIDLAKRDGRKPVICDRTLKTILV